AAKAKAAQPGARPNPNVSPDVSVNDPVVPRAPGSAPSSPIRSRLRVAPAWLGVAFLAGAFACGLVLRLNTVNNLRNVLTFKHLSKRELEGWQEQRRSYP